jgi:hypothetical protein
MQAKENLYGYSFFWFQPVFPKGIEIVSALISGREK